MCRKIFLLITIFYIFIPSILDKLYITNTVFGAGTEKKPAYKKNVTPGEIQKLDNKSRISGKKPSKIKLTNRKVLEYLIKNNNDVKKLLLDYRSASIDVMSFRTRFNYNIFGNAKYSLAENPNKSNSTFLGESTTTGDMGIGLKKYFRSGTSVSASISGLYQNIEGAGLPGVDIGGKGYQTGIKLEVKQELLKNIFGYSDRLAEQKLMNKEKLNRLLVKLELSRLLVDALAGYWNVAIAEENLDTSKTDLDSTVNIRNLIIRKLRLGLSEREDILDWNGKVLQSRNNYDRAGKTLFDARLAVIRTLNLDSGIDIEIGKTFSTYSPKIKYEQALKEAFSKRVDWLNQKTLIINAELEYKIAYSNLNPSLQLSLSAGNQDYDRESFGKTFNDINREYSIGLELNYPLGNTDAEVKLKDAMLKLKRVNIDSKILEKSIKDEVRSIVKQCDVNFKIYDQTKRSRSYAQNYYYQVYRKFRRGRYSALELKLALDSFIRTKRDELKSLIDYNIALLKRDFSRNMIFEKYGIDIDRILKKLK